MDMESHRKYNDLSILSTPVRVDLQHFGGEKTEKATSKKRRDAKEKGQVVQSKELAASIQLFTVFFAINVFKDYIFNQIFEFMRLITSLMETPNVISEMSYCLGLLGKMFEVIIKGSLPILGVALVTGVVMSYLQVGAMFTVKTLQPKFDKINPINGFKRLFSMRSLMELFKSVAKAIVLLYITGSYLITRQTDIISLLELTVTQIILLLWDIIFNVVVRAVLLLVTLGILDFAYKFWQNEKDMMMSKQEIKDEYKMTEGDPQLKGKIKQKQREISMRRMMQDVPKADVIITNPSHFAVAIKYNPDEAAPKVVAKGKDLIAKNIKRVAEENDIPIVENKPLARALYSNVDIGTMIPEELFHAVAEVLAYVYRMKESG